MTNQLVLPNNYIELDNQEMMYLAEGALAMGLGGLTASSAAVVGAIGSAVGGAALGTLTVPGFGTISLALVGAYAGGIFGFVTGFDLGYSIGRRIERRMGWG